MPISNDYLVRNGRRYDLVSLVVYAPLRDGGKSSQPIIEEHVYVPQKAIALIKGRQW